MKKTTMLVCGLLLGSTMGAWATVTPLIIRLDDSAPVYSVPTNKVLLIEHVNCASVANYIDLSFVLGGATNTMQFNNLTPGGTGSTSVYDVSWPRPLRVPGGYDIRRGPAMSASRVLILLASLVDTSDLYAAIGSQVDNLAMSGGMLTLGIALASPRPAALSLQQSGDLTAWSDASAQFQSSATSKTDIVATATPGASPSFYRVKAVGRP